MVGVTASGLALFGVKSRGELDQSREITQLLSRKAAAEAGLHNGQLPGDYAPVYGLRKKTVEEAVYAERETVRMDPVYATRDKTETRDVFTDRDVTENRDVYEQRTVYERRDITEQRDVTEQRDIVETRAVYETRDVFETRDIRETTVEGDRDLRPYNTLAQAGIDVGADFSVKVGDGAAVTFRFDQSQRLSVTVNGTTQRFNFTSAAGSMRNAMVSALNSVAGLQASVDSNGKLKLTTTNAQSLAIADVANSLLDFSGSPLAALGLTAGTTNAKVVGQEQVKTGTQQVQIGTQQIVTGSQSVVVGQQMVVVGSENVAVGTQSVLVGSQSVVVGTERVKTGTETVVVGTERYKAGETRTVTGKQRVQVGTTTREVVDGQDLIGLSRRQAAGLGDQSIVDQLKQISAGASHILKLFERLPSQDGSDGRRAFSHVGAAYRENSADDSTPARQKADKER